jgi:4-amino-4-deoxy-L-arabinose transferase-like glycosyltransferase
MLRARSSIAESTALAFALVLAFGALYVAIAYLALDAFPFSGDEYSAALQSELFARGRLAAPAPAHAEWLRVDHVVIDQWVRSKYPPGGPALLAIGARAGVAWLVTPVIAMLALVVVWHAVRRAFDARAALAALVILGAAPLFAYEAATFYSHVPAMFLLAVALACVGAWTRGPRDRWLVGAGLAIGAAFLIRPADAVLFGVAMVMLRSPRAVIVAAASALPFVALGLVYNNAQFGSPFTDGYAAYAPTIVEIYGAHFAKAQISPLYFFDPVQQWNHIDIVRAFAIEWTVPATVVLAVVGALAIGRDHPARALRNFSLALVATFAVVLLVTIADHDDGARPRYLSTALVPVVVLAAAGFAPTSAAIAARLGRRARTAIVTIAIVLGLAQLGAFLERRVGEVQEREGLYRATAAQYVPDDAVVIVRARFPSRFARNGPFFDGVLYLSPPAKTTAGEIAAAYPNRPIYEAHEGEPWTVERVR